MNILNMIHKNTERVMKAMAGKQELNTLPRQKTDEERRPGRKRRPGADAPSWCSKTRYVSNDFT